MSTAPNDETRLHWEFEDGLPRQVTSGDGTRWLWWTDSPRRLVLRLPDHRTIAIAFDAADHPILGRCDVVVGQDGATLAHGSRTNWRHPTQIPALDRPGALPTGAGTAILNLLAWQAMHADVSALRYAGPYPSLALWSSLASSFVVHDPDGTAQDTFLADATARAATGRQGEIAVDFRPAPHRWSWPTPEVCVQHREGIERVYIGGRAFDRGGHGLRVLRADGDRLRASICIGMRPWHDVASVDPRSGRVAPICALPTAPSDLLGICVPSAVSKVVGEVVIAQAPLALQPMLRTLLPTMTMEWADVGNALVVATPGRIAVHAALVEALPTDSTALLGTLVQLVETPLRRLAAATLAERWADHTGQ